MATTGVAISEILDLVASLMNDTAKQKYTYTAMTPYFNMALARLQEHLELAEIPVTENVSWVMTVYPTQKVISVNPALPPVIPPSPPLPHYQDDLIEIQQLWERLSGSNEPWIPMYKRDFLPHYLDDLPTSDLVYWTWINNEIQMFGATTIREVKMDYIRQRMANMIAAVNVGTTSIDIINSRDYLWFKTAALCARYIGENPARADALEGEAEMGKELMLGINIKGKQDVQTRRKPFLAGYKMRSNI